MSQISSKEIVSEDDSLKDQLLLSPENNIVSVDISMIKSIKGTMMLQDLGNNGNAFYFTMSTKSRPESDAEEDEDGASGESEMINV